MANRRMFSKSITSSSRFLMMSQSAQNLYFHLGMNADDDGFCEHFTIMRMTESKPDDLSVLQARGFVKIFDEKVLVVTDWKENNYIQKDRYTPSKYLKIYKQELKQLADGQPKDNRTDKKCIRIVSKPDTQVRLGKVRKGKVIDIIKDDIDLTILLYKLVKQNYSHIKEKTKKQLDDDYAEMNRLHRIDNWTYQQIRYVIEWSQNDAFWKQNIRSVKKLRKQFETLVVRIKSQGEKNQVIKI